MGNYLVCGAPARVSTSALSGKPCSFARLVLTDGTIQDITSPVTVAELMLDHPLHFVCHVSNPAALDDQHECASGGEARSFDHDKPLTADTHLESGEIYYLRSKAGFNCKSPLRSLQRCSSDNSLSKSSSSNPRKNALLHAFRLRQKGSITQVTVSADMVAQILRNELQKQEHGGDQEKKFAAAAAIEDDNPELQMALQMRLISRSVSWRPKLATIQESGF
ncbi:uncharacterized protein LOC112345564 [Selaginella moellendorffii]|uniref:uncharacterized protein LOC112345564 n=1 Tax=Selaginella moellendorffii TaxID=88036 RepID=UPI000D1C5C4D|nr:uncharacterized protein LOC112345564 [Selaginella moellendorffii]|eukprot:XP_024528379.1 uncharacterized protein LOC112345564 [Selaginella moellendorffii]